MAQDIRWKYLFVFLLPLVFYPVMPFLSSHFLSRSLPRYLSLPLSSSFSHPLLLSRTFTLPRFLSILLASFPVSSVARFSSACFLYVVHLHTNTNYINSAHISLRMKIYHVKCVSTKKKIYDVCFRNGVSVQFLRVYFFLLFWHCLRLHSSSVCAYTHGVYDAII